MEKNNNYGFNIINIVYNFLTMVGGSKISMIAFLYQIGFQHDGSCIINVVF